MRKFWTDPVAILNYLVYVVGLYQVKNYFTFKAWYTKIIIEKNLV